MDHELLYQYNPWWEGGYEFPQTYPRIKLESQFDRLMPSKSVIFLTGLRRVGKTTLMKSSISKLLKQNIKPLHILYISMDDYLLRHHTIIDVVQEYKKLHKISSDQFVYLFLDEVAYVDKFRQQLKNLYDKGNAKIVVSSSSSSALKDTRGWLTGRERIIEVSPLSFDEYLIFRDVKVKKRDSSLLETYFEEYMQDGGMPEYILTKDREYLNALLDDIIYKDIIAHYKIRHSQVIIDYFNLLMERSGKQISLNKVANILKISPDTAKRYLTMFEETYLIYLVPRYGKTNEEILSPKKIYAADNGIRHLFTGFRDKGAIFENIVYNIIKHKNPRYVFQDGIEIDFMTEDKHLIEVKYGQEINDKQKALFDTFKAKRKTVIHGFQDLKLLDDVI